MDKEKSLSAVLSALEPYGAAAYEYNGVRFIAIKNADGRSYLAVTFGDECMAMEFATQSARFAYGDEADLIAHVQKFLADELCAVEFFFENNALFGGSRPTVGCDFSDTFSLALWYAAGKEDTAQGIDEFLKKRQITVLCFSWSGRFDRAVRTLPSGDIEAINS